MKTIKMHRAVGTMVKGYAAGQYYDVDDELADSMVRNGHAEEIKPKKETLDKEPSPVKAVRSTSKEKADKSESMKA